MARLITTDTISSLANPVTVSLVGHWPLNEGSGTVLNDTVSGNNMTLTGVPGSWTWGADTPGAIAGSGGCIKNVYPNAQFSGLSLTASNLPIGATPRTVSFWFNFTGTEDALVSFYYGGAKRSTFQISKTGALSYYFPPFAETGLQENLAEAILLYALGITTGWHHYAMVYDGSRRAHYIDGVLRSVVSVGALLTDAGGLSGMSISRISGTESAMMKDIRVYDGGLTPAEIAALAGV